MTEEKEKPESAEKEKPESAEKEKPESAEKEKPAKKAAAGKKALFKESLVSVAGNFQRGKVYEIPEKYFAKWEKAKIVEAAKSE